MAEKELENLNLPHDLISNILRNDYNESMDMVLKYLLYKSDKKSNQIISETIINDLINVAEKYSNNNIGQSALDIIINITASDGNDTDNGNKLIKFDAYLDKLLKFTLKSDSHLANHSCKILTNLTRNETQSMEVANKILENYKIEDIINAVCDKTYNKYGLKVEYFPQMIGNLTQSENFRMKLLDDCGGYLQRLLPVLNQGETKLERYGIASILYNCLLDVGNQERLLDEPYEVLPVLLYPLAGPEEFKESEYEELPLDLQYLPEDKTRENDTEIRHLLLKSLLLLCRKKKSREFVRNHGAYLILREYHKWEKDCRLILATENIVDLLIRTEDEIGVDDVGSVEIPEDMTEKLVKMDEDFIESLKT